MVNNTCLITALVVVSIFGAQIQQVNATILGDAGNNADTGFDAGRAAGISDRQDGQQHDSKCPPNDSLVWCGAYKVGYSAGYYAQGIVKGAEDENNNNNNNNNNDNDD